MESKYQRNLNTIVVANNFNRAFKSIYHEFEKEIFLKLNHIPHTHASPNELSLDERFSQTVYHLSAVYYMRIELTSEHVNELRDTIFSQLYPAFKVSTPENMDLILRSILKTLAKEIFYMDVITFDDIKKINYRDLLLKSKLFLNAPREQTDNLVDVLNTLPEARERALPEFEHYVNNLVQSRAGLWKIENLAEKAYQQEIETQFILSEVKLK